MNMCKEKKKKKKKSFMIQLQFEIFVIVVQASTTEKCLNIILWKYTIFYLDKINQRFLNGGSHK